MKIIDACFAPFRRRGLRSLAVVLALLLTAAALLSTGTLPLLAQSTVQEPAAQGDGDGAVYTVQRGDSWSTVAEATGVSVAVGTAMTTALMGRIADVTAPMSSTLWTTTS